MTVPLLASEPTVYSTSAQTVGFNRHPPIDLLREIISAPGAKRIQVCATGAGVDLISDLARLPGSSSTFTGGQVPYHQSQLEELLGYQPTHAVSEETAVGLAQHAYLAAQRVAVLSGDLESDKAPPIIGLGMTGAVATSRERRGLDHVWIAVRTIEGVKTGHFVLEKGFGEEARALQNELAGLLALNALAGELGVPQTTRELTGRVQARCGALDDRGMTLTKRHQELTLGEDPLIVTAGGEVGALSSHLPSEPLIFPGSFRSFHCGHDLAAVNAMRVSGKTVAFEISAVNADKAPIDASEIARRVVQFYGRYPVIVTPNAPLFVDKSRAYPVGTSFVIGFDTAERLLDPRFYVSREHLEEALQTFRARGNTFYVLGRQSRGEYRTIIDLPGYAENKDLFRQLMGQLNISSSSLAKLGGINPSHRSAK